MNGLIVVQAGENNDAYYTDTGRILGQGSFCIVKEITQRWHSSSKFRNPRGTPLQHPCLLALKQPRNDLSPTAKENAVASLKNEIQFLSTINHSNIIKAMKCISWGEDGKIPPINNNMIVLEKLQGTLREKIVLWNDRSVHLGRLSLSDIRNQRSLCSGSLWNKRIEILSDIANAMNFLHSNNILMRDLKTENCGFDATGRIKIFDFGLAVRLCEKNRVGKDRYEFSIAGGTLRYMSPEAALGEPIGKASDVYAFALLVWETMALEIPFEVISAKEFLKQVVKRRCRPKLDPKWPKDLKVMLAKSWTTDSECRPSFQQLLNQFERWCGKRKTDAPYADVKSIGCCLPWLGRRSSN